MPLPGFDPSVVESLLALYKHFKALEKGNHPPSAAFWAAMADSIAQAITSYLNATIPTMPPAPPYTGPTIGPMPGKEEMERREARERRRKIIEEWEEYDREKERHLPE